MSFTSEIKQEVSYNELKNCCARAELSALIQLTSSLIIENKTLRLVVRSESPTTSKRVVYLLKKLYKAKTELLVAQKTNLRKNNVYTIKILDDAKKILIDLGLYNDKGLLTHPSYTIVMKDCCARAYLAGAFVAFGSCNSPATSNYHLEISLTEEEHALFIQKLIARFGLEAKISMRRNKYVVYLKKADSISDFLKLIGAHESLMNFENVRISRDFKNSLIRVDNCEIANEMKSIDAARKQMEWIRKIKENDRYERLDEKLKNVIDIREKYQDYSLLELCDAYQKAYGDVISKSGMKHRFDKIENIAKSI